MYSAILPITAKHAQRNLIRALNETKYIGSLRVMFSQISYSFLTKIATFLCFLIECRSFTWYRNTIFWKHCILPWPKIPDFEDIGIFVSQICLILVRFSCKIYYNTAQSAVSRQQKTQKLKNRKIRIEKSWRNF